MEHSTVIDQARSVLRESQGLINQFKRQGWVPLGDSEEKRSVVSYREAVKLARKASEASPLIIAGIRAYELLVHARNRTIKAADNEINQIVQELIKDNKKVFFGLQKRMEKEQDLWTDAKLYIRFFANEENGAVAIRFVEPLEITRVISDPEDKETIWLYERHYGRTGLDGKTKDVVAFYPDMDFIATDAQRVEIESQLATQYSTQSPVFDWDSPIYHVKLNKGLPECYAALSWAKCYESLLQMIATVYGAISAISLVVKVKAEQVQATSKQLAQNKKQKTPYGNAAAMSLESDVKTLNAKSALMAPSNLDSYLGMVVMVFGLAPHLFGKSEQGGGLGSDQHRHEAMNLAFESRQSLWIEIEQTVINFALLAAIKAGGLSHKGQVERVSFRDSDGLEIGYQERISWNKGVDSSIDIIYPPIRKRDVATTVSALISAATMNGQKPNDLISPRTFYQALAEVLPLGDVEARLAELPEFWTDDDQLVVAEEMAIKTLEKVTEVLRESLNEATSED